MSKARFVYVRWNLIWLIQEGEVQLCHQVATRLWQACLHSNKPIIDTHTRSMVTWWPACDNLVARLYSQCSRLAYNVLTTCPQASPMLAMHKNRSLNIAAVPILGQKLLLSKMIKDIMHTEFRCNQCSNNNIMSCFRQSCAQYTMRSTFQAVLCTFFLLYWLHLSFVASISTALDTMNLLWTNSASKIKLWVLSVANAGHYSLIHADRMSWFSPTWRLVPIALDMASWSGVKNTERRFLMRRVELVPAPSTHSSNCRLVR
jgi:hypothetical protein